MKENDRKVTTRNSRPPGGQKSSTLDSYQTRYLALAILVISILIAGAWFGHHYVTLITNEQIARMGERTKLQRQLQESQAALRQVTAWLQRQLVEPGIHQQSNLESRIARFRSALPAAEKLPPASPERKLATRLQQTRVPELTAAAKRFLQLSHANDRRFPATVIMQTRMRGRAESFLATINEVIDELSVQPVAADLTTLLTAYRLRDTWQKIIGEFRLLVANRFGVFADDPLAGVQARARNIELYFDRLQKELQLLDSRPAPEDSLFLGTETWRQLSNTAREWREQYRVVLADLSSDNWRRDLEYYKKTLTPRLDAIRQDLEQLQHAVYLEAADGIRGLSTAAENLTRGILLLALLLVVLMAGAYLYLRTRIIRPIAETTRALRHEALGLTSTPLQLPKVREIRELVNAFAEMKREVQRRQRGLDHLAHHDPLTQLPNRVLFKDRLEHAVNLAKRNNQVVALLFLDLDNFKQINDTLGHLAGDELLVNVARRLKNLLRHTDTVARFGGDEFAILLENIEGKRQARNIASKILNVLSEPIALGDQVFHLTASIGIAMAPYDDSQPDNLIRDADTAMYEAKRRGKNAYSFFSSELLQRATTQLNLEREVRAALERNEFIFHYQPIVHTNSKKIYGVEALMRWNARDGQLHYPGEFMDTLLNLDPRQDFMENLMVQVDRLQERCLQELQIPLRVSINMSASVLRNAAMHSLVLNSLKRRAHPELLHIEITEDTLLEDLANARVLLTEIKRLGIPLVLDDFGTGQSSLNHLRSFPFDAIKIDREFVMNMDQSQDDATLVKAITQLAHSFNMKVVAEGVENQQQYRFLNDIGCDYIQGYLISKPTSPDRLFALLSHMRTQARVAN